MDKNGHLLKSIAEISAETGWPVNLLVRGIADLTERADPRLVSTTDGLRVVGWPRTREFDFRPSRFRLPANQWRELRNQIFARDDYTCQYCGARGAKLECDHKVPVSRGGSNDPDNLATACFPCNRSKRDKTPEEWAP